MKYIAALFFLVVCSCNDHPASQDRQKENADTITFYPAADFFKRQVKVATALHQKIYSIVTTDGKKDSSSITPDQFRSLANTFIDKDITKEEVRRLYKESVFHDLGTKSYTLNYTTNNHTVMVQNMDILLDEETNNVKRIFIRTHFVKGDTSITEQYSWKADQSFRINTYRETKNGYTSSTWQYVNWNESPSM